MLQFSSAKKDLEQCYNTCATPKHKSISEKMNKEFYDKDNANFRQSYIRNAIKNKDMSSFTSCSYPKCKPELQQFVKSFISRYEDEIKDMEKAIKDRKSIIVKLKKHKLTDEQLVKLLASLSFSFPSNAIKSIV